MKYCRPQMLLLVFISALIISCSTDAKTDFDKIVLRVDKYLSKKPILVGSQEVIRGGEHVYVYYALRIVDYNLSHHIRKLSPSVFPYKTSIRISSNVLHNAKSGDVSSDIFPSQTEIEGGILSAEASGFTTVDMALRNTNFSTKSKLALIIKYTYEYDDWICNGIEGSYLAESFFCDLETFPQNKQFRTAIGMKE